MNDASSLGPVLVIIPTYNESQNIESIASRIRRAVPEAHLLIADDNSPDGTGEIADRLAGKDDHIHVLHRKNKQGLGAAYLAGFHWGLDHGYDVLVEHDADGSHQPEQLPALLQALEDGADMARGSRWVRGGSVVNWPLHRELISRAGSLWTRVWLGIPVKDTTGGFNAFKADTLRGINLDEVASAGYCFQIDLLWRTIRKGYKVTEVPIEFVEREFGDSKMNRNIVIEALIRSTLWGLEYRAGQLKAAVLSLLSGPKTRRRSA
ncbi:MAG TPA: polyprenol monophosphomannose synthase [Arachnia sp.]|nr:polyprenol monophosphomannose synthase [Arachnia sp.]HMT85806.1 polyprenol monophosphomannose synthase [Arachnia sp.]